MLFLVFCSFLATQLILAVKEWWDVYSDVFAGFKLFAMGVYFAISWLH